MILLFLVALTLLALAFAHFAPRSRLYRSPRMRRLGNSLRKSFRKLPPFPFLRRVGRIGRKLFAFCELPVGFCAIFANSSQVQLGYVAESVWGTVPGSPSMLAYRFTSADLDLPRTKLVSDERRPDGQTPFVRLGMKKPGGTVSSELSWKALKDFIAAALRYNPTLVSAKVTGAPTIKCPTTSTITRTAGSFVTDGFVAGGKIRTTGMLVPGNNGIFTIAAVVALTITTVETTLTVDATGNTTTLIDENYVQNGVYEASFDLELGYTDIVQYFVHTGCKVDSITFDTKTDAMVTVQTKFIGKDVTASGSSLGSPAVVDASPPTDSYSGTIAIGGTASTLITSLNVVANWSRKLAEVIGLTTGAQVNVGRLEVNGKMDLFFQDLVQYNNFLNETVTSLNFVAQDPSGNQFMIILPAIKYTAAKRPVKGNDPVMLGIEFEAFLDTVSGTTMQINMIPAIAV